MAGHVGDIQKELARWRPDAPNDNHSYGDRGPAFECVPDDSVWMIPESGPLVFALGDDLGDDLLFVVNDDLTVASYPIDRRGVTVTLNPARDRQSSATGELIRTRTWTFRGIATDPLMINGRIAYGQADYCDEREAFARALAGAVGWKLPDLPVRSF